MNAFSPQPPPPAAARRRERRGAFALVITLLILSLLIVVAVSYLSSMVSERQTADAYTAKARAEQAAQAGVDSAMAVLSQSFRDFPDSATVWDVQQSKNSGSPSNPALVSTPYNEGTSLYLRAVPDGNGFANPSPNGVPSPGATPFPANDPNGNDPNNPACKNFVLPLISGVPSGQAKLVSNKAGILPDMRLDVADPVLQNYTDLNVRRFAGDLQGVIGSPPNWTATTTPPTGQKKGPKPARALWVDLKDSASRKTGRYAYWIEDESFRTNLNSAGYLSNPPSRADNTVNHAVVPQDMFLAGTFADFETSPAAAANDAAKLLTPRDTYYPGKFFPDPLAFSHAFDGDPKPLTAATTLLIDAARYLTTTQSGALNLTRHGSQRLNLNATTTINPTAAVSMPEIRKLVETIRFHLPNFGQRFYRNTNPDLANVTASARATILNRPTDVGVDAVTGFNNAEMYLYKTAANLRDYIDADDQPTLLIHPASGLVPTLWSPGTPITHPFGGGGDGGNGNNYMWAQGKDGAPFIQEAMVRYRPAIQSSGARYTLAVDYYVEVWNMSDHDVNAASLHNPYLLISAQQPWGATYIPATAGKPTPGASPDNPTPLLTGDDGDAGPQPGIDGMGRDFKLDLVSGVFAGNNPTVAMPTNTGIVFKAGQATVITTDPDFVAYPGHAAPVTGSIIPYGGLALGANGLVAANTYYCSVASQVGTPNPARRFYQGPTGLTYRAGYLRGIIPLFRGPSTSTVKLDFEVEATLANDFGYLDCATGAFCLSAGKSDAGTSGWDFTWTPSGDIHNDYIHGGTLAGNGNTVSQTGDPRGNNEQLVIQLYNGTSFPAQPDQYRYGSPSSGLAPPFSLGSPNSQYFKPAMNNNSGYTAWPDYYDWPAAGYPVANPTAATAPSVVANSALTSIGQLGDIYDPARLVGSVGSATIENSRGGGRTLKIGQRDDRYSCDPGGNAAPYTTTADSIPASNGWAAWRLTDVFGIADALELPARVNINGVARDGGAALRAALTGFTFQPPTTTDPLVHGAANLTNVDLKTLPTDSTGLVKLVNQIQTRLAATAPSGNTPYGPFFERGELGELENGGLTTGSAALFGRNIAGGTATASWPTSTDLTGKDLNRTFDRGREELFRRLAELICTRGDTFTVYAVGQSLVQTDPAKPARITGTHRMRVTFRLVPKKLQSGAYAPFHPGYLTDPTTNVITGPADFDADNAGQVKDRFAKPDRYDVQVLEVNTL